jgi:hypothetical protein
MLRFKTALLLAALCLGAAVLPALAQTPAEDVHATLDAFLAGAVAQDADAVAPLLDEHMVAFMDVDQGVTDRDAFLKSLTDDPAPGGVTFGDYEPTIIGDVALVVAPIEMPEVPFTIRAAAVLLNEDDGWKLLAIGLIIPIDDLRPMIPATAMAQVETMQAGLPTALEAIEAAGRSGDSSAFAKLCMDVAPMAGPYGEGGAMAVTTAAELLAAVGGAPRVTSEAVEGTEPLSVTGFGCALVAIDATVTPEGGEPRQSREIAMLCLDQNTFQWRVLAAVEAPKPAE